MNIHEQLAKAGIVVYKDGNHWFAHGDPAPRGVFNTYDEAFAHAVTLLQPKCKFSAIVRLNRGLGVEYRNLPDFEASLIEAHALAGVAAESYVKNTKGMEKAVIQEVKIRPIKA